MTFETTWGGVVKTIFTASAGEGGYKIKTMTVVWQGVCGTYARGAVWSPPKHTSSPCWHGTLLMACEITWCCVPGRVWDMRTGRSVVTLEGHVKPVLALDFSPNGYHVVSGSEDHSARVWDLRKRQTLYTIPAHTSSVSQVPTNREAYQSWKHLSVQPESEPEL